MKKLILSLFSITLMVSAVFAQDAKDLYKDAKKAYNSAIVSLDGKTEQLNEAAMAIEKSLKMADQLDEKDQYRAYKLKGDIYLDLSNSKIQMSLLGKEPDMTTGNEAVMAFEGFLNAYKVSEKKYQKRESLEGLQKVADNLTNYGRMYYGVKDYAEAYNSFNKVLVAKKALDADGEKVILPVDSTYYNHLYLTGLAGMLAEKNDEAKSVFMTLYESGNAEPAVYENLFKLTKEQDEDKATSYLDEGRKKYPDDEGLRIAEINYYLQAGKLSQLTDKLQAAIDKDPKNISLYTTLGYVHDNLFQKEKEAGNDEAAQKHYNAAMEQYQKATEMDPDNGSVLYSIGALIYNKAAVMTQDLAELESDYSPAGIKKYEAKKAEIFSIFDEALPYFQKAEAVNANDVSTLIALKEIYAKKDDLEMSKEFKERLEKVQAGETLESSYFEK